MNTQTSTSQWLQSLAVPSSKETCKLIEDPVDKTVVLEGALFCLHVSLGIRPSADLMSSVNELTKWPAGLKGSLSTCESGHRRVFFRHV